MNLNNLCGKNFVDNDPLLFRFWRWTLWCLMFFRTFVLAVFMISFPGRLAKRSKCAMVWQVASQCGLCFFQVSIVFVLAPLSVFVLCVQFTRPKSLHIHTCMPWNKQKKHYSELRDSECQLIKSEENQIELTKNNSTKRTTIAEIWQMQAAPITKPTRWNRTAAADKHEFKYERKTNKTKWPANVIHETMRIPHIETQFEYVKPSDISTSKFVQVRSNQVEKDK